MSVTVTVIYLLTTIIKHYKAACTINELDSKADFAVQPIGGNMMQT